MSANFLYRNGVRLWLAGHEHDHMVQPIGYLDMLQAGELRMEENTNATVLIGEFDEQTNTGNVTAYSWFPEGWAKYPILWHDGTKEEQYPFQLRLPGDEGLPREAVKAKQANKEFVSRIHIIDELIPKLDEEGNNLGDILKNCMEYRDTASNYPGRWRYGKIYHATKKYAKKVMNQSFIFRWKDLLRLVAVLNHIAQECCLMVVRSLLKNTQESDILHRALHC